LYVPPPPPPDPSISSYGFSPGSFAGGATVTFSATVANAVGSIVAIGVSTNNEWAHYPVAEVITSNPQTISRTFTAVYGGVNQVPTIGTFNLNGVGTVQSVVYPSNPNPPAPPPSYNESVSGPSSIEIGQSFSVNISGGAPNTGVTWSGAASGSATLDGSGNGVFNSVSLSAAGNYSWTFVFAATGHSRTFSITAVAPAPPPASPSITDYYFSNPTFVPGQNIQFYAIVANAVGITWAMGIYQNGSYLPTTFGTITSNPQTISYPFTATVGYHVGTFILTGLPYVQSSYNVP